MPIDHEPPLPHEQATRCLKYIQRWREHLVHAWVGHLSGAPDMRAIGNGVDDLVSLVLLVEKARRTSPESVPALRDVIASSAARSIRDLWTAVGRAASSPILESVFQTGDDDKQISVPDNVLNSPWPERIGEVHGHFWYIPNVRKTAEYPHVLVDVNYWKTFVHSGLATAAGDRGSISLFGREGRDHELFAEHVAGSETWVEVRGLGRIVHEWSPRPTRSDNHWLDCLVGCAAAASMCGVKAPGQDAGSGRQRKRYTQDDLRRR